MRAPAADRLCAHCGTALRPAARFCDACGRPVAAAAAARDPRAYTPRHLAEKILGSRAVLAGERKQVTVLFADVTGSMDLAEQVDPEAWHGILDRFFTILAEGVHRFEGTVNQFTGDGIMALFGAPLAHEDHARRACLAALHLREALGHYAQELRRSRGLSFAVRMGLNSGEVVVGAIGDDLRMDYTAQGHTVGLAQRMEQLAEPGRVYVTGQTAALVAGYFTLRDLGAFAVKGVRQPVRVHALEGEGPLRTRLDVSRARGFSRFVGREEEMAVLDEALAGAIAGRSEPVGVVAEPGVGKSRLCWEFVERCRARGIAVHEAHAVAHGASVPYLVALELVRGFFDVTPQDGDEAARRKIAGTLLLVDEALREAMPFVFEFLGVADAEHPAPAASPETRQRTLATVMRRVLQAQSERRPMVVLVEDLHWLDAGSETFLHGLVEALPDARALLVLNFRPEYHLTAAHRSLALRPLAPAATSALLGELLGADASVAGLAERIATHTRGNPFFVEEAVRALAESGHLAGSRGAYRLVGPVAEVVLPATVQAVLGARIDRLGEGEKAVLQTAAVIGKEFGVPVLARVTGLPAPALAAAVDALVEAEFVAAGQRARAGEYVFCHPLTQEVAYRSQLGAERARIHAAVAEAIAALHADKLDERAALLAHHWEGAGNPLEAARWNRRAAEWLGRRDFTEGLRHWRKVRTLVADLDDAPEPVALRTAALGGILNCGVRVGLPEGEKAAVLAELAALSARSADPRARVTLIAGPAALEVMAGEAEGAIERLVEARRLADESGSPGMQLALCGILVLALFTAGRFREALALVDEGLGRAPDDLRLGSEVFGFCPHVLLLAMRGILRREAGDLDEGARDLLRSAELARELGELEMVSTAHQALAFLAWTVGDAERAVAYARRALEEAETIDSPFARTQAYEALGMTHLLREEWDEAANAFERALAIMRESGTGRADESLYLSGLAEARLARGEPAEAEARAAEAVAIATRRRTRYHECHARLGLARVLLGTRGLAARGEVEQALARALALADEVGATTAVPLVHVERAALARLAGDEPAWRRELDEARRRFAAIGATVRAARIAAALESGTPLWPTGSP